MHTFIYVRTQIGFFFFPDFVQYGRVSIIYQRISLKGPEPSHLLLTSLGTQNHSVSQNSPQNMTCKIKVYMKKQTLLFLIGYFMLKLGTSLYTLLLKV